MKMRLLLLLLGTACLQGMFSQSYFQQEVNYTLSVSLDDIQHTLRGFESVQYINNSPDDLSFLWFHIWPNAYKDNSTAMALQLLESGSTRFQYASEEERGYIDSLDFRVNGGSIAWLPDDRHKDICKLILNDILHPGDTIIITTPFYVKLPGSFSRFGHKGQAYQVSQWYPKPAVYDRHGWNQMPYLDQGEFYSEFGSFDVTITLPKNYVVGATGNLLTNEELQWLEEKSKDTTTVQNIPASDHELKTIRYSGRNIHDFAWFADKRYRVLKGEVLLSGGRKVTTWAMYTEMQKEVWKDAIQYINDAIRYYSAWYGDYPYDNCTAVYGALEAGGAMEYPTITVVGNTNTAVMLENFIMHEVGHNWFYGVLGFNERKYPFLDEGLNTFSEMRYMTTKYPQLKLHQMLIESGAIAGKLNVDDLPFSDYYYYLYLLSARSNMDQPLNLTSEQYTSMNYGMIVYQKSALVWNYLLQYLGEEKFNNIMQQFYRKWQFRHPDPEDLRAEFEIACSENLSWFFNDLLNTSEKMDYAVKRTRKDQVLVKNSGRISSPLHIASLGGDSVLQEKWFTGFTGKQWLELPLKEAERIKLFNKSPIPEINRRNNTLRTHGLLRRIEPMDIHPLQILEKSYKTSVGIMPAIGWNNYNKTQLGILLYSPLLPQQTLEYQLAPMFGLGNRDISGMGRISFNLYPRSSMFQAFQLSLDARRFGQGIENGQSYKRIRGELLITLKNASAQNPVKKTVKLGLVSATERMRIYRKYAMDNFFATADIGYSNPKIFNPYRINLNFEANNDFVRSSLELNYTHAMRYAMNAISFRVFASGFLFKEYDMKDHYAIRLSGNSGIYDYKFEHLYLGRFEDITDPNRQALLSQQFVMNEGGFATNVPFAFSDKWLATLGVTLRIPKVPLYLYATAGTYSGAGDQIWDLSAEVSVESEKVAYETGVMASLGNFVKVYFPVVTSHDISEVNKALTDNYWQTIRYVIDFNAINPFKLKNRMF
ncbi:MAG: M1 family metallopeptidase [Bacteroidales bacterium]|nr:M1 family metallopeptidase [Bacteroidales bacterium]